MPVFILKIIYTDFAPIIKKFKISSKKFFFLTLVPKSPHSI